MLKQMVFLDKPSVVLVAAYYNHKYIPTVKIVPRKMQVQFICHVSGYPKPTVIWKLTICSECSTENNCQAIEYEVCREC